MTDNLRQLGAMFGGPIVLNLLDVSLQVVLVAALADTTPADEAAFLAARSRPLIATLFVISHAFAAVLTGYIIGRAAGSKEVRTAAIAAGLLTTQYVLTLFGWDERLPPGWVIGVVMVLTPPALMAGAYVYAEARAIRAEQLAADSQLPTPDSQPGAGREL